MRDADAVLAEVEQRLAALPDEQDLTPRDAEQTFRLRNQLRARVTAIAASRKVLAAVVPQGERLTAWRLLLDRWRAELSAELLGVASPIRDHAIAARSQQLVLGIRLVDFGERVIDGSGVTLASTLVGRLMLRDGATAWLGGLEDVDRLLSRLTTERDAAEAALDEALLSDDARRAREQDQELLRDAYNRLGVKLGEPGQSVVVFRGGKLLDPAAMTDDERRAVDVLGNRPKRAREAERAEVERRR